VLLRAVGLSRPQLRRMIRSESVIVSVYGALLGTVVGTALGIAITEALRPQGITALSFPILRMVAFIFVAAVAGVIAAIWPARRAARLNVLDAIASE
jgi:putative ABC transport system permease protein